MVRRFMWNFGHVLGHIFSCCMIMAFGVELGVPDGSSMDWRYSCEEVMQRPLLGQKILHDGNPMLTWKELGLVHSPPLLVDPSMCFSCSGVVRSVDVWVSGPFLVQFFTARCNAHTCTVVSEGKKHEVANASAGMHRLVDGALTFASGDCLGMRLEGVAFWPGLPHSTEIYKGKKSTRQSPGVLVFDEPHVTLHRDLAVGPYTYMAYSIRMLLSVPAQLPPPAASVSENIRDRSGVALVVRSFSAERDMLVALALSCEWFIPYDWPLVVVLDDSEEDREMVTSGALPNWVHVVFEKRPAFLDHVEEDFRGPIWAMWSQFWADNYTNSSFVVLPDSDSIFHTFGVESLLFRRGKPVVWAQTFGAQCFGVVDALGLAWVAEFMSYLPFVVHANHLAELRQFVQHKLNASSFDEAFLKLHKTIGFGQNFLSTQALAGAYLYHYHRRQYHWSVEVHGGKSLDWSQGDLCPAMRAMTHLAYWNLPDTKIKGEKYTSLAREIITWGVCLASESFSYAYGVPVDGLPEALRESCSKDFPTHIFHKLKIYFSWQLPAYQWSHIRDDSPHCASRMEMISVHDKYVAQTLLERIRDRNARRLLNDKGARPHGLDNL